jgi:hypothetical protein
VPYLVKSCDCEDWPCCVHADDVAIPAAQLEQYDIADHEPQQCNDYQDLPQSECETLDCPYFSDCWD